LRLVPCVLALRVSGFKPCLQCLISGIGAIVHPFRKCCPLGIALGIALVPVVEVKAYPARVWKECPADLFRELAIRSPKALLALVGLFYGKS
jgi:hypothetical protein